jgi:hypothetical protein
LFVVGVVPGGLGWRHMSLPYMARQRVSDGGQAARDGRDFNRRTPSRKATDGTDGTDEIRMGRAGGSWFLDVLIRVAGFCLRGDWTRQAVLSPGGRQPAGNSAWASSREVTQTSSRASVGWLSGRNREHRFWSRLSGGIFPRGGGWIDPGASEAGKGKARRGRERPFRWRLVQIGQDWCGLVQIAGWWGLAELDQSEPGGRVLVK